MRASGCRYDVFVPNWSLRAALLVGSLDNRLEVDQYDDFCRSFAALSTRKTAQTVGVYRLDPPLHVDAGRGGRGFFFLFPKNEY